MELKEIKTILYGIRVPVEVKRQAWIEYGGLLAQCPYKQGAKIGKWVRDQGLDFVRDRIERSASVKLFNCRYIPTVKFDDCPHSTPTNVLKWLRDNGLIEVDRKESIDQADKPDKPDKPGASINRIYNSEVELRNAFNSDEFEMRDGFITNKPIGSDWNDAITERILDMNDANHGDLLGYADGYQLVVQYKKVRVAVSKVADSLGVEVIS